ncbi:hypothetical protein PG993_007751 [Apiospora rasikravindrae]|uniref:Uncharacterized protein n=1 Tax=Apiospora rasikravindrae TaxID=990691 RepID=A0ABR1SYD9_9PEZI
MFITPSNAANTAEKGHISYGMPMSGALRGVFDAHDALGGRFDRDEKRCIRLLCIASPEMTSRHNGMQSWSFLGTWRFGHGLVCTNAYSHLGLLHTYRIARILFGHCAFSSVQWYTAKLKPRIEFRGKKDQPVLLGRSFSWSDVTQPEFGPMVQRLGLCIARYTKQSDLPLFTQGVEASSTQESTELQPPRS